MEAASKTRWGDAQTAEAKHWTWALRDLPALGQMIASYTASAGWIKCGGHDLPGGDWADIGVGPLGLSPLHFLREDGTTITGIEPLEIREPSSLSEPLRSLVEASRVGFRHQRSPGEETGLPDGAFSVVGCFNALDHVLDPRRVLLEARRLLKEGGILIVECDARSLLGELKWHAFTKRRHSTAMMVRAHPHRFRASAIVGLVRGCGFVVDDSSPVSLTKRVVGRAHVLRLLARAV